MFVLGNYSWELAKYGLLTGIIMLLLSRPWVTYRNPQSNNTEKNTTLFFILYILVQVFSFWEWDTYHSAWGFQNTASGIYGNALGLIDSYEAIYNWLASTCSYNYWLWRICIWVPAVLFYYYTAKRLKIVNGNLMVALILFMVFNFSARNMLGITMLLYGVTLRLDDNNSSRFKLFGLGLVVASYFFHKTMYVTILFALLAFFPFGKKTIRWSIVLFPLMTVLISIFTERVASGAITISLGEGAGGGNRTVLYTTGDKLIRSTIGTIGEIIELVPQYLVLFYCKKKIVNEEVVREESLGSLWNYLWRFSYVALYIASTFAFVNTSDWIYTRFKYIGLFPLILVLAKVWSVERRSDKWIKCIIIFQLMAWILRWLTQWHQWS